MIPPSRRPLAALAVLCLPSVALAEPPSPGWKCEPRISIARRLMGVDSVPRRAQVERVGELREFRFFAKVKGGCPVGEGADVSLYWVDEDLDAETSKPKRTAVGRIPLTEAKGAARATSGTTSIAELLLHHDGERLRQLDDDATSDRAIMQFRMPIAWEYCVAADQLVACPAEPANADGVSPVTKVHRRDTFLVTVAKHHDEWTLSLVTQPGRFQFTSQPCRTATSATGGALPLSCADGDGGWTGAVGASALGVKVFYAPMVSVDWFGISTTLSTASMAFQSELGSASTTTTDTVDGVPQLYVSPVDLSFSPIDFRLPQPMRIDIGPSVGVALVSDGPALRTAFIAGVNISAPLVDIFGKRYGRNPGKSVVDYRELDGGEALRETLLDLEALQQLLRGSEPSDDAESPWCTRLGRFSTLWGEAEREGAEVSSKSKVGKRLQALEDWWLSLDPSQLRACGVTPPAEAEAEEAMETVETRADELDAAIGVVANLSTMIEARFPNAQDHAVPFGRWWSLGNGVALPEVPGACSVLLEFVAAFDRGRHAAEEAEKPEMLETHAGARERISRAHVSACESARRSHDELAGWSKGFVKRWTDADLSMPPDNAKTNSNPCNQWRRRTEDLPWSDLFLADARAFGLIGDDVPFDLIEKADTLCEVTR